MIEFASLASPIQAALLVGLILVQAIVLYLGYGILERVATPVIKRVTT